MAKGDNSKVNKKAGKVAQEKLDGLEEKLSKQSKSLPQLSTGARSSVVSALPWLSGVVGLLALVWAKDFWDALGALKKVQDVLGDYGGLVNSTIGDKTDFWIMLIGYLAIAVCIGIAFSSGLLNKAKRAWNFLFYAYGLSVIVGILYFILLSNYSNSRALLTVIIGAGGLYALFQVRDAYK
jgi:hypothetical protein